jgi:HTH-type transcriptional regulator/antitoxin MqsA
MRKCDICDSVEVVDKASNEQLKYKDSSISYLLHYSVCQNCGNEFVDIDQIKSNDIHIKEAKKKYDGLLSAQEIVEARSYLHLTQDDAALVFGGGKNAFSKYERNEVTQSTAMDKLIRVSLMYPLAFQYLKKMAGVSVDYQDIDYSDNIIKYPFNPSSSSSILSKKQIKSMEIERYG